MKRVFVMIILVAVSINLGACSLRMPNNRGKVKVIPRKENSQEMTLKGIERLAEGIAWDISSDGQDLLYSDIKVANPGDLSEDQNILSRLYRLNVETGDQVQLATSEQGISDARFSYDGETIAYMEITLKNYSVFLIPGVEGEQGNEIDTEEGNQQNEPEPDESSLVLFEVSQPFPPLLWVPNKEEVLLKVQTDEGWKLVLYNLQGNQVKDLVQREEVIYLPQFYNDSTLFFGYQQTIWAQSIKNLQQIQKVVAGFDYLLSPNGQMIAYRPMGDEEGKYTLRIDQLNAKLRVDTTLTEFELDWSPRMAWSPDSRYLAYSDGGNIWIREPKGNLRKLIVSGMEQIITLFWRDQDEFIFSGIPRENGVNEDVTIFRVILNHSKNIP